MIKMIIKWCRSFLINAEDKKYYEINDFLRLAERDIEIKLIETHPNQPDTSMHQMD